MHEILNNPNFPFKVHDCYDDFHYMRVDNLRKRFPQIWSDIQRMSLYNKYKPYIDFIYNLVSQKRTWLPKHLRLKEAWGIINIPQIQERSNLPRFKTISLNSIWGKVSNKKTALQYTSNQNYDEYYSEVN